MTLTIVQNVGLMQTAQSLKQGAGPLKVIAKSDPAQGLDQSLAMTNRQGHPGETTGGLDVLDLQSRVNKSIGSHDENVTKNFDVEWAREASRLQSLQIQKELGLQPLNIANASPETALDSFD